MSVLNDVYQVAYVTNDMPFALDLFRQHFSIENWKRYEKVRQAVGDSYMINDTALAFAGAHQIEVIAPIEGADGFYRDILPADRPAVRFHHHGYMCTDEAHIRAVEAKLTASGTTIPIRGHYAGSLEYLYADTRDMLGHYIEYICLAPEAPNFFSDVPRH